MKNKILATLAFVALLSLPFNALALNTPSQASVNTPAQWVPNFGANTITPNPNTLQVPCANIVGGCNGGTANTTSTSFTTATSSAPSYIANLNSSLYLPSQSFLNTYGCPGFPNDTTIDVCANDWVNFNSGKVSSTNFFFPNDNGYVWSDPTGFNFQATTTQETVTLNCVGGRGTVFHDNATTGTVYTAAWGQQTDSITAINNCSFVGGVTNQTSSANGGLQGITLGSPHITLNNIFVSGFSAGQNVAANAYDLTTQNSTIQNSGYLVYAPAGVNNGESGRWNNDFLVNCANATTSNCIYLGGNGYSLNGTSNDGAQIEVLSGSHVTETNGYHETTGTGSYGGYPLVNVASGGTFDEKNGTYVQDGTGSNDAPELILNGGHTTEDGVRLTGNPSSTPDFIVNTGSGVFNASNVHNDGGVTNIIPQFTGSYLTSWEPPESYDSAAANGGVVNTTTVRLFGPFTMSYPVVANAMNVDIVASDTAADIYDFAIYYISSNASTTATKVFSVGAQAFTTTGVKNISSTQGTVYFGTGNYLVGITGNSSTLKWGEGLPFYQAFAGNTGSSVVGTSTAPATTSIGTASYVASGMPTFSLHD